jgi:hypothetical protein
MKMIQGFLLNRINMNGGQNAISHGLQLAPENTPNLAPPRLTFMKKTMVGTQPALNATFGL